MNRRKFISQTGLLSAAFLSTFDAMARQIEGAVRKDNPLIMITSGWQPVNIGDIAHTPGLIGLLKKRLPNARLILWKKSKNQGVEDMLVKHYPGLNIIHGSVNKAFESQSEEVKQAFREVDFFIHGSGPSVVAQDYLEAWHRQTGKPFGIFGVTIGNVSPSLQILLPQAKFIFTRETASIEVLKKAGITGEHIAFAPDATFDLEIQDKAKAQQFMDTHGLENRKFICVIPRLRVTPYYKFNANKSGWSDEYIKQVDTLNDAKKEVDHAKLREAMIAWVRTTKNKIVACPEMTYQVDIIDELLIDPLPDDVKPFVVKHDYWYPDEAASLYAKAHTVLSFECHSPIIAAVNGTPAFYLRQPQDTIKGQMYYDLGLFDWTFEIEQSTGAQITEQLMRIHSDYPASLANVKKSLAKVQKQYDLAFSIVKEKIS
ncbi:polysaccharide pyruvyl transferase family protein [Arundinibacter roseus]|uniref:Polysaccharide pyruvyl transferase family protein n=1 Tax=Arundinibacter roseus TaxID=2070510 RepID=A0A4R4KIJ4_9BACT|nr:polysaccharide pyruvyl transferase family protein [Arundinibacter roseus]TDB67948.1 polysaccharide pyruvyl transferase family protein [Arundinibacter roseus]